MNSAVAFVGGRLLPYSRISDSFLPSLVRVPPEPAVQPAWSSRDLAWSRSYDGRFPARVSPGQIFGGASRPVAFPPTPPPSTAASWSMSSAVISARRTATSTVGLPSAWLNSRLSFISEPPEE
jgi:hypothetical protein